MLFSVCGENVFALCACNWADNAAECCCIRLVRSGAPAASLESALCVMDLLSLEIAVAVFFEKDGFFRN
ncbi:hypothetical protein RS75_00060 [Rhizobium nepotum 39/7]|uniref:Uncharacterized protein n=1 Tax=Rhizobium nepotum 39/7 TaxID=1368418 RepID=A0ABR5CXR9_9HYPH|nr:hypothetical protein RS75_00060 [Rhizobium nepotum 39/7]